MMTTALTRSRYPLSAAVEHMRLNNPFIRELVMHAQNRGISFANDAQELQVFNRFRQNLKAAVLQKERDEHKRRLTDEDTREVIQTALQLQNIDMQGRDRLIMAANAFAEGLERAQEASETQELRQKNKKLEEAQTRRQEEEERSKRAQENKPQGGHRARSSLSQTLNNKIGYDPEMAFSSAVLEVMLLCSLETLIHFAIAYRKRRPEGLGDILAVLGEVGAKVGHRFHDIVIGDENGSPSEDNGYAVNAAYMTPAPRPRPPQ